MSFPVSQSSSSAPEREGGSVRGVLVGVVPLLVLVAIVSLTLLLTLLARQAVAASGFFAQQQMALIVLVSGLVLALLAYGVAIWLTLRRVAQWLQQARVQWARAALWALVGTALVTLLPVLLALLLPQHPAP